MDPTTLPIENVDGAVGAATAVAAVTMLVLTIIMAALAIFMIICLWKVFTKAGKPGWASIIPIYNMIIELEIIGQPLWWIILAFIPIVNFVVAIIIMVQLGKVFGKDAVWSVFLLLLFPFIGLPILAFGQATYSAPNTPSNAPVVNTPTSAPTGVA